jgi:alkaline phosphatase D
MVAPLLSGGVDFNPDSWEGYRANRDRVLDHIERDGIDNVIFLTGDVHSSWVFDVPAPTNSELAYDPETGVGARAVEFVVPAVSSPPLGDAPGLADFYADIQQTTPHLEYMNLREQGFVILDLTPERVRAEYIFTDSAKTPSSASRCGALFEAQSGSNHVVRVDSTSCGG